VDLLALLYKEAITVRRNLAPILLLVVLLPASFALGTVVYENTVPQDVPVAVVAADENTTDEDLDVVETGVRIFGEPRRYDSTDEAVDALKREQVYLVIEVPGGLHDANATSNFTVYSDRGIVPFHEPSAVATGLLDDELDTLLAADVNARLERVGRDPSLSEYLVPTATMFFVVLYSLVFLPRQVRSERSVFDRLRTESSLEAVLGAKLLVWGLLLGVGLGAIALVTSVLGYTVAVLSPLVVAAVALAFVYLAATGLAVLFALNCSRSAIYVNFTLAGVTFAMSSLFFPVGFFSGLRADIARLLPTHYTTVAVRSGMLKSVDATLYFDYLGYMLAAAIGALVLLELSLVRYRRAT
jgi:ABC-2 type transport system permease protein